MPINVRIWTGTGTARVTDMTNAGRRGKTCRVLRFSGCQSILSMPDSIPAAELTDEVLGRLQGLDEGTTSFDSVATLLTNAVDHARSAGITEHWFAVHEDQPIRSVDAPKPELTAGNDKWSGQADADGIRLKDLTDRYNEPCEITSGQTAAQAYKLAAKVWPQVQQAQTMHEASKVLREAGCKLHYFCAVD